MEDQPQIVAPIAATPPMPPEIGKAVIKVMSGVSKLSKDNKNPQGGYKYTSVDDFFEMLRPLMAEAALFDMLIEVSSKTFERKGAYDKTNTWLESEYDLYLYHESGAFYGPLRRKIQVIASGPQAYASAQSFVEKYFLRSLFKIATGDVDADDHPQDGLPKTGVDQKPARQSQAEDDGFASSAARYVKNAKARISEFKTLAELKAWWAGEAKTMDDFFDNENDQQFKLLKAAYVERGTNLQSAESALNGVSPSHAVTNGERITDDKIPY